MNAYEVGKRLALVFDDALAGVDLRGKALLDAGCGTGLFSRAAADRGARVTSMDVGKQLLAEVRKKCDSRRIVGDVLHMPFDDAEFDVVICTEVIEHTTAPRRAIYELARVVKPRGLLVLTTPNRVWHIGIRVANALRLRPYEGLENWVRWGELRVWFDGAGLDVRTFRGFNAVPFVTPILYGLNDRFDALGDSVIGRVMINILAVAEKLPGSAQGIKPQGVGK